MERLNICTTVMITCWGIPVTSCHYPEFLWSMQAFMSLSPTYWDKIFSCLSVWVNTDQENTLNVKRMREDYFCFLTVSVIIMAKIRHVNMMTGINRDFRSTWCDLWHENWYQNKVRLKEALHHLSAGVPHPVGPSFSLMVKFSSDVNIFKHKVFSVR